MRKRESSGALIGVLVGGVALLTLGVVAFRPVEKPVEIDPHMLHVIGPTPVQARMDNAPPALYRQDWVPAQSWVGVAEPRSGWRRVVDTGTTLAGPVNPTVARPPRFYKDVPVDLFNREVRLFAVDLRVPSKGFDFILARVYTSRSNFNQVTGGLAYNWDYTYNRHLVIQGGGDAAVCDGLGREDVFVGPGPTFTAPTGIFDTLVRNGDNTFTQTNVAGMKFNYNTAGWLTSMVDRAGNTLTITRDGSHKITTIRDTNSRDYTFAYDGAGRLNSVTDFANRQVFLSGTSFGFTDSSRRGSVGPMVRQARLDFPGALHHVMARGIERRDLFWEDADRQTFLGLLGETLAATGTGCYAWALMPNHVHLLLTTGQRPLARVLQKVLGGYATRFNRRRRRAGHLFQNRYKSILCDRDAYFQELVRYLHLNPVRARIVRTPAGLAAYPWTGHAALLGRREVPWQDTASVLALFGRRTAAAREAYAAFVEAGFAQGRRRDLMGGGLIRSVGGWRALEALRRRGGQERGDERILGSGDFVTEALAAAEEALDAQAAARQGGWTPDRVLTKAAAMHGLAVGELHGNTKRRAACRARELACWWLVEDLGLTATAAARLLGISIPAASLWVTRARAAGRPRLAAERIERSKARP